MKRRDFLHRSLKGAAGAALLTAAGKPSAAQSVPSSGPADLAACIEERKGRPLYFDGLTFFGAREGDLRRSGLSGLVWDVSTGEIVDGKFIRRLDPTLKAMAAANRLLRENPDGMFLATRGSQIRQAHESGRTAVFLQFQSAESFDLDVDMIDVCYELGLRISQFTHHYGNAYAGGCLVKNWTGLTGLGHKALERMNQLGIIPDLAHGNEALGLDVLEHSRSPVIISHTGCRALVRNARCAPDSVIRGVAESGGVVGLFSMSFWLTEEAVPTMDSYLRQIEHVIQVGGIDAVGISNDFDVAGQLQAAALDNNNKEAVKDYFPWWRGHDGVLGFDELPRHIVIPELNHVRRFYSIQAALEKKGYRADRIEKIMGGNWERVLTECLG